MANFRWFRLLCWAGRWVSAAHIDSKHTATAQHSSATSSPSYSATLTLQGTVVLPGRPGTVQ